MTSNIKIGRVTIWTLGLSKYIQAIKKEKGDYIKDAFRTLGFLAFTGGMIAPQLYYGAIGKGVRTTSRVLGPYAGAALLGAGLGIVGTTAITNKLEREGILSEGATLNYLEQHTSLDTAWSEIYSPNAIKENISTIWNHYF